MESARLTLHSCSLRECKGPGLDLSGSAQATVSGGSSIAQCVGGVWMWDSSRATLQGASVAGGPSHAILADGAASVEVRVRQGWAADQAACRVHCPCQPICLPCWAMDVDARATCSIKTAAALSRCCCHRCRRAQYGGRCMPQRLPGRASCTPPTRCWTQSSQQIFHQRRGPSALSPTASPASSEAGCGGGGREWRKP